jgi:membrane-associated phospholipid phosphatase
MKRSFKTTAGFEEPGQRVRRCLGTRTPLCLALAGLILLLAAQQGAAQSVPRQLTDGEEFGIYGASATVLAIGGVAKYLHPSRPINNDYRPNALDRSMRRLIHGETDTLTNLFDKKFGSMLAPAVALIGIGIIDIDRAEFSRDVPFYLAGMAATNGITVVSKTLAKRPRPYCLPGGCPPPGLPPDSPEHYRAFFSGHTSKAFYAAGFFNLRFRRFMRRNWTPDEYRVGRWVSPAVSFGVATLVGLSRIHADKHYFTDVLAGAIVGTTMAELYYWLAYESADTNSDSGKPGLRLSVRFTF